MNEPPGCVSRDFRQLLGADPIHWRDEVHQHHPSHSLAGLITPDWHLILHRAGEHRLFDLAADPDEMTNRSTDPACAEVMAGLTARILAHHEDTASPAAEWLRRV